MVAKPKKKEKAKRETPLQIRLTEEEKQTSRKPQSVSTYPYRPGCGWLGCTLQDTTFAWVVGPYGVF